MQFRTWLILLNAYYIIIMKKIRPIYMLIVKMAWNYKAIVRHRVEVFLSQITCSIYQLLRITYWALAVTWVFRGIVSSAVILLARFPQTRPHLASSSAAKQLNAEQSFNFFIFQSKKNADGGWSVWIR